MAVDRMGVIFLSRKRLLDCAILHASSGDLNWGGAMRLSILSLLFCASTVGLCQSPASGAASSNELPQVLSPAPPSSGLSGLPRSWQLGIPGAAQTVPQPNSRLSWLWDRTQMQPTTHFVWRAPNTPGLSSIPLLALNQPSAPNLLTPHGKGEPIPTQWPNAKVERIPTQWRDLKFQPIKSQAGAPVTTQNPGK
jgi:hypothetical protein